MTEAEEEMNTELQRVPASLQPVSITLTALETGFQTPEFQCLLLFYCCFLYPENRNTQGGIRPNNESCLFQQDVQVYEPPVAASLLCLFLHLAVLT